jgi:cell fate (sporulation/competence/biofilm development) regulator YlbF (YheA/YmcA/DUF963 family)
MPNDGGNLLFLEEKNDLIEKYPNSEKWFRKFVGGREFINELEIKDGVYIEDDELNEANHLSDHINQRLEKIKNLREN